MPEPRFVLVLAAAGGRRGDAPAEVRLRLALKVLGRRFGLRCVEVRREPAEESQPSEVTP